MYLQDLLGLNRVQYAHVPLLVDDEGRRLAKRNKDASLDELALRFKTPEAIIGHIAWNAGLVASPHPVKPAELLKELDANRIYDLLRGKKSVLFKS